MGDDVTCTVCGDDVGRRGLPSHSKMHRREFREAVGRPPENYEEVRERADGRLDAGEMTLDDFAE